MRQNRNVLNAVGGPRLTSLGNHLSKVSRMSADKAWKTIESKKEDIALALRECSVSGCHEIHHLRREISESIRNDAMYNVPIEELQDWFRNRFGYDTFVNPTEIKGSVTVVKSDIVEGL